MSEHLLGWTAAQFGNTSVRLAYDKVYEEERKCNEGGYAEACNTATIVASAT